MLSISVDLDADIVSVARGIFDTRLHRAADPQILRQARDRRVRARNDGCRICRAVIDDQRMIPSTGSRDLREDRSDGRLFIVAGNDQQDPGLFRVPRSRGVWA